MVSQVHLDLHQQNCWLSLSRPIQVEEAYFPEREQEFHYLEKMSRTPSFTLHPIQDAVHTLEAQLHHCGGSVHHLVHQMMSASFNQYWAMQVRTKRI